MKIITNALQASGFNQIKETVINRCVSDYAKELLTTKQPSADVQTVEKRLAETHEAMLILASGQHVPFMGLAQIKHLTQKIEKGLVLEASELTEYGDFLRSLRLIAKFFEKNQYQTPTLNSYAKNLTEFKQITDTFHESLAGNRVQSNASKELKKIRTKIAKIEADIEKTCDKLLKKAVSQGWVQDRLVVKKEDRYTLPIKATFQSKITGSIIERSNRGTTVFIEPSSVSKLNDQLILAKAEEVAIIYQVLASLTGMLAEEAAAIGYCMEIVVELDLIFARGKYSQSINGKPMAVNQQEYLIFDQLKHPLLKNPVPLDLTLGRDNHGLIITGPNAGGKTVVLKTIALVCLMTSFGLCVNHGGNSSIGVFKKIFIDIGDQQSLENSLSTFSAHMQNVSSILKQATGNTLVLLDEIGSGTEPNEGAALGIAAMEEMYLNGATLVATTHYGEIKDFALQHEDFQTAAMAFDSKTLTPKYRLLLNQVGDSNAFWIARKMDINEKVLKQAKAYLDKKPYQTKKITRKIAQPAEVQQIEKIFEKGDRVWSSELEKTGLFYDYQTEHQARISIDKQLVEVAIKRLTLKQSATDLYPPDYDLDQLFIDFHERKFDRDIDRGSKKAQKTLRKLAETRETEREKL